jgi:hypothetical protein
MDQFSSFLDGGGGGGSGKAASSASSSTSGNNFGGGGLVNDSGGLTPLAGVLLAAMVLFAFVGLVIVARK